MRSLESGCSLLFLALGVVQAAPAGLGETASGIAMKLEGGSSPLEAAASLTHHTHSTGKRPFLFDLNAPPPAEEAGLHVASSTSLPSHHEHQPPEILRKAQQALAARKVNGTGRGLATFTSYETLKGHRDISLSAATITRARKRLARGTMTQGEFDVLKQKHEELKQVLRTERLLRGEAKHLPHGFTPSAEAFKDRPPRVDHTPPIARKRREERVAAGKRRAQEALLQAPKDRQQELRELSARLAHEFAPPLKRSRPSEYQAQSSSATGARSGSNER